MCVCVYVCARMAWRAWRAVLAALANGRLEAELVSDVSDSPLRLNIIPGRRRLSLARGGR